MGWVVNATPWPLYTWERPVTHCIGGWVGPKAGLSPLSRFDPRTVQPVVSRYTNRGILAHILQHYGNLKQ
jgi:hypothetical protein